jgi:hypothetical protein
VLNARPRIDTGRLLAGRPAAMSSLTSPSIDGSWEAGGAGTGYDDVDGGIMSRGTGEPGRCLQTGKDVAIW